MLEQVAAVRAAGAHGVALFSELQLTDAQVEALAEGPFRDPADAPHSQPLAALRAGVADVRERLEGPYEACLGDRVARRLDRDLRRTARLLRLADRLPEACGGGGAAGGGPAVGGGHRAARSRRRRGGPRRAAEPRARPVPRRARLVVTQR